MTRVALISILSLLTSISGFAQALAPGMEIPEIPLKNLAGESKSIKDYRGKVVLLNFWATWCAPCVAELPELQAFYEQNKESVVVVGVAVDDIKSEVTALVEKKKITFPILLDNEAKFSKKMKVDGFPESFLVDRKGKLTFFYDGWRGPTLKIVGPRRWSSDQIVDQIKKLQ